jgi:hypothetical protein
MEISNTILNTSQHPDSLPAGNGAHYSVHLLEKAPADAILKKPGSQLSRLSEAGGNVYSAVVSAALFSADCRARVIPQRSGVSVPLESARILWQR